MLNPIRHKRKGASNKIVPVRRKRRKKKTYYLVSKYGLIHIFFDALEQHFHLRYYNPGGSYTSIKNVWAVSFIDALVEARQKADELQLITTGMSIAPIEEDERIVR